MVTPEISWIAVLPDLILACIIAIPATMHAFEYVSGASYERVAVRATSMSVGRAEVR